MNLKLSEFEYEKIYKIIYGRSKTLAKVFEESVINDPREDVLRKAREHQKEEAQCKIKGAVELLRLQGKKVTALAVSRASGVSRVTISKYKELLNHGEQVEVGIVYQEPLE